MVPFTSTDLFPEGSIIDERYRLLHSIGEGGMGSVYAATDIELKRLVAIKFLQLDSLDPAQSIARFRREAKILSRLTHPNVITFYRFGVHEQLYPYIAMEHIKGTSLRGILDEKGPFDLPQFLAVSQQICEGLTAAHQLDIVHRDLKPGNVLLTEELTVKLIDFGLSRINSDEGKTGKVTQTGLLVGSTSYMSPEQCAGTKLDARADIYSLGCLLFEMLTGRPPFIADTPVGLLYKHLNDPPPLVADLRQELPSGIVDIIERCLAKSPDERYRTAADLGSELALVATGQGSHVTAYRNQRKSGGSSARTIALVSAGVFFVGCASAAVLYMSNTRADFKKVEQRAPLVHKRATLEGQLQEVMRLKFTPVRADRAGVLNSMISSIDSILSQCPPPGKPNALAFQALLVRAYAMQELAEVTHKVRFMKEALSDAQRALGYASLNGRVYREAAAAYGLIGDLMEQINHGKANQDTVRNWRAALSALQTGIDSKGTDFKIDPTLPGIVTAIDFDFRVMAQVEDYAFWAEHDEKAIERMEKLKRDWLARCGCLNGSGMQVVLNLVKIYNYRGEFAARDKLISEAVQDLNQNQLLTGRQRVDCHLRLGRIYLLCSDTSNALKEVETARDLGALLDSGFSWSSMQLLVDLHNSELKPTDRQKVTALIAKYRTVLGAPYLAQVDRQLKKGAAIRAKANQQKTSN